MQRGRRRLADRPRAGNVAPPLHRKPRLFPSCPGLALKPERHFAVVRYQQTAALFRTPMIWCIEDLNGNAPVVSDSKSLAGGIFATEAGARAVYEKLEAAR